VQLVGKPYDLRCTKDNEELFVEVKGTQTPGATVLLTKNEVDFARRYRRHMALFILHSARVIKGECLSVSGGISRVLPPWDIDRGLLVPTECMYTPAYGVMDDSASTTEIVRHH
jgi:hypothetical protein